MADGIASFAIWDDRNWRLLAPALQLHIAIIPVVIWMIYRFWRLAKDEIGITGGLAVGFILARIVLDGVINMLTGIGVPIT